MMASLHIEPPQSGGDEARTEAIEISKMNGLQSIVSGLYRQGRYNDANLIFEFASTVDMLVVEVDRLRAELLEERGRAERAERMLESERVLQLQAHIQRHARLLEHVLTNNMLTMDEAQAELRILVMSLQQEPAPLAKTNHPLMVGYTDADGKWQTRFATPDEEAGQDEDC